MSYAEDNVGSACANSRGRGVALWSEISGMEMVIHRATANALARALVVRNTGALEDYNTPMWLRLSDLAHHMALVVVENCEYGLEYHTSSWSLYKIPRPLNWHSKLTKSEHFASADSLSAVVRACRGPKKV